jgi:hypothetical protein
MMPLVYRMQRHAVIIFQNSSQNSSELPPGGFLSQEAEGMPGHVSVHGGEHPQHITPSKSSPSRRLAFRWTAATAEVGNGIENRKGEKKMKKKSPTISKKLACSSRLNRPNSGWLPTIISLWFRGIFFSRFKIYLFLKKKICRDKNYKSM